jgi:hypothetical protein
MSTLKLSGVTSGSSILKAPDTGSTGQIFTMPASTGTLAKTSDLLSGITDNSNATAMTIGADENIGIGVVPEAWHSSGVALQVGAGGTVHAHTTDERIALISNAYEAASDGNWYRNVAGLSGKINIDNGTINFQTAPTGSADGAVSWTTYFNMSAIGRVGINKASPDARLEIVSATETALHCETTVSGEYAFIAKSSSSNSTPIADFRSGSTSHLKVLADGRGLSQYTARAWLNYNGSGNSIRDSHNVTSVGDWGTGNFGIYITNGLANTNYAAVGMGQDERYLSINTGNTAPQGGRLDFECHLDNGNWSDQDRNCIVIFGDY